MTRDTPIDPPNLAGILVRRARERSGLSQRDLGKLAGTTQSAIARIETGTQDPSAAKLQRLIRHAGFELSVDLRRIPAVTEQTVAHMRRLRQMTIEERIIDASRQLEHITRNAMRKRLRQTRGTGHITHLSHTLGIAVPWGTRMSDVPPIRLDWLLQALKRFHINAVITGAIAARVRGFPVLATRLDVAVIRTTRDFIAMGAALRDLKAHVFSPSIPKGLPFDFTLDAVSTSPEWQLVTDAGRVRLIFARPGTSAFDDLRAKADFFDAFGVRFLAASLTDILNPMEITGRFREPDCAPALRAMIHAGRTS